MPEISGKRMVPEVTIPRKPASVLHHAPSAGAERSAQAPVTAGISNYKVRLAGVEPAAFASGVRRSILAELQAHAEK